MEENLSAPITRMASFHSSYLNKTHPFSESFFYQVIVVFRRFTVILFGTQAEVIYNLTRNVVVNMHFLRDSF